MLSQSVALGFRKRSLPPLGGTQRVSQAAIQAAMLRGALERNSQSISPKPDPLPPAPLLGLVELAAIGIAAALGEVAKRIGQLWGSNNNRPAVSRITDKYLYYRIRSTSYSTGWIASAEKYPAVFPAGSVVPAGPIAWPGALEFTSLPGTSVGGALLEYRVVNKTTGAQELYQTVYGSVSHPALISGIDFYYEFANSNTATTPEATWTGASNTAPGSFPAPDDSSGNLIDPAAQTPLTSVGPLVAPLVRILPDAVKAQQAPAAQTQTPPPEAVQLVPVVEAAGALVQLFNTVRTVVYVPAQLPAPLRGPATATQATTTAGALVPPAAAAVPTTANDSRRYGSRTVTAQGVRPDVASIAEEVGRIEQKVGQLLAGMDNTPDWLDALSGQLLSQLLQGLLDALIVDVPATTYELIAPCDKDENGDPVEWSAEIEAADYQPAMVARLDAIAEALGVLKGWKQPICRATPPRSNVTVTAYEYDPEA